MADFPLLMTLLASDFAPASRFCHIFLRQIEPRLAGAVKLNSRLLQIYGIILIGGDKSKHKYGDLIMIQCLQCDLCEIGPDGRRIFKCDPFSNIKEPECVTKWQLIRLDMLLAGYQSMIRFQKEMEPLQRKMMKFVEREMNDVDESDKWKIDDEDIDNLPPENDLPKNP
jgi:hypothetical protein